VRVRPSRIAAAVSTIAVLLARAARRRVRRLLRPVLPAPDVAMDGIALEAVAPAARGWARSSAVALLDPKRGEVVLFGGLGDVNLFGGQDANGHMPDTWLLASS